MPLQKLPWQLHDRDGTQAECGSDKAVQFCLHLLAWWHQKNLELIPQKTTNGLLQGMAPITGALHFFFTAFPARISPAVKLLGGSPVTTKSFQKARAQQTLSLAHHSRQFLSSVPSLQSRSPSHRFQLGMHLCSCWHSNSNLLQRPGSAGEVAVALGPVQSSE